jgi:hypothetical protein
MPNTSVRPARTLIPLLGALAALLLASGCAPRPAEPPPPAGQILPALPTELALALDQFRAEGPTGWAFTQATSGGGKELVERYDPRHPGPARWTLLAEKGQPPTEEQQTRYRAMRPAQDSSSELAAQLDRTRVVLVATDDHSSTYEFALRPASEKDTAAAHMRARVTLDRPSGGITRVELFNFRSFKPAISLTIHEARTTLTYTPPTAERPALPLESRLHIRGERVWFRDFEQTVVSTFQDHEKIGAHD